ncbi:MAG TPA: PAS domain S-box protein [Waterburya sp.]|jgi:PAS domain S-box-containing protein
MNSSHLSLRRRQIDPDSSARRRGALIISIPVICLFASLLALALLRSKSIELREQEKLSQRTITQTYGLLKALVEAETGVRGYLLTRRPEFLEPYLQAKTSLLPKSIESLRARVLSQPARRQQFQKIQVLVQQQITLWDQISRGGRTASLLTLNDQLVTSKLNMDHLRQEIGKFAEQEERFFNERTAEEVRWRDLTDTVQRVCFGIGLIGAGAALYLFQQLDQELAQQASQLRESNVYLQAVFDSVVDGILILNERGYIQALNAAAEDIFAYERDEIPGLHLQRLMAELFAEDSGQVMRSLVGNNQHKLRLQQETVGRCKNGKTFPMEFAISEMQLDNEHLFIAIVRDITERRQWQETLLKQAQLLNLANDTIIVRDLNDTITYWNQGAQRLYGFSSAQAIGQSIHALLKTEFPQPLEEIREALFQQGYWSGELLHSRQDGIRVAVKSGWTLQQNETGEPMAYLEINQDITKRKQSEAALRQSEELYRTLVKNFPNGAVFLFDDQMRYTVAEGTGLATVNLTSEELTGKTIWETLPRKIAQVLEPIYREALQGKSTVTEMPFGDRLYQVHVLPVINKDGKVLAGMAMTQDITQSKRAEKALRSRAEELARLTTVLAQTTTNLEKRNAELDQFAYIVSHDLKAPLRAIANLSQWLEEDLEEHLSEDTRHQMNLLRNRVHRMEALINGLLQYSRVGRLRTDLELVDVEGLLAEVIDSLAPPPEFTITVMPGMPTLWTERLPLEQVFANLISNGIKHNHRTEGQIVISAREQTDDYEFVVSDNGPGIAPEFHEKVFVMFQTLESRDLAENTGVGLAIVKKIIDDKGGTISLESNRGQGATFRFSWPKHPMR